jgi:prepilin-type N-terminal cleavage/methylation domain-containing protein
LIIANERATCNFTYMKMPRSAGLAVSAFSLVEILIVIAVIGILSGLAVTFVGGTSDQAAVVVARQQQMELQTALDAWIVAQSSGTAGLAGAQTAYSTQATTMLAALAPYLREPEIFTAGGAGVSSQALGKIGKTLRFSSWASDGYPKVLMQ